MRHYFDLKKKNLGFTLVELLIAVSLSLLLVVLGLPAYLDFNDRRQVIENKQRLETAIQDIINITDKGEIVRCQQLLGYNFWASLDGDKVYIKENCLEDDYEATVEDIEGKPAFYDLTNDVVIENPQNFDFFVDALKKRITDNSGGNGPWVISLSVDEGRSFQFELNASGAMSSGDWEE